ncbi:MAG: helix-turn-helix domain-containing protein [Actinomycetota bacterium]
MSTDDSAGDVDKRLCTVEEAAAALSLGRTSVFHLISEGRIRTVKVGARRLVPTSSLDEFVADLLNEAA